jgi:hypothetical protein
MDGIRWLVGKRKFFTDRVAYSEEVLDMFLGTPLSLQVLTSHAAATILACSRAIGAAFTSSITSSRV